MERHTNCLGNFIRKGFDENQFHSHWFSPIGLRQPVHEFVGQLHQTKFIQINY